VRDRAEAKAKLPGAPGPDREDEVPEACRSGGRPGLSLGVLAREVRAFPALSSLSEIPRIRCIQARNAIHLPDWLSPESLSFRISRPRNTPGYTLFQSCDVNG